jgi:hypothetical protein
MLSKHSCLPSRSLTSQGAVNIFVTDVDAQYQELKIAIPA